MVGVWEVTKAIFYADEIGPRQTGRIDIRGRTGAKVFTQGMQHSKCSYILFPNRVMLRGDANMMQVGLSNTLLPSCLMPTPGSW